MILNMTGGGGGSALNFKVTGGTVQPAGRENLIWVNTDTAITDWTFKTTQPTTRSDGTALSGGEVWFQTGSSSETGFNALKRNGIWVYPGGCRQYTAGEWVYRAAKTYQNGAWADWEVWLYNAGNEFAALTGGWAMAPGSTVSTYGWSLTKNAASMTASSTFAKNNHNAYGFLRGNDSLSLNSYSALNVELNSASISPNVPVRLIVSSADTGSAYHTAEAYTDITTVNTPTVFHVDLSTILSGSTFFYGISFSQGLNNGTSTVDVNSFWFS